jgi:hypothetical protein
MVLKLGHFGKCFEMWCWRRMEKISLRDRVRNEEALRRIKQEKIAYIEYKEGRLFALVTS